MTGAALARIIGKTVQLTDARTGQKYQTTILDAKDAWGKIRIQVVLGGPWFEFEMKELIN
jgi:hypothetical protein